MRRIPTGLRNRMDAKPEYHRCMLTGMAHEKIDWHHAFLYAGRQVNEEWCIIPLLHTVHANEKKPHIKERIEWIMLNRATDEELEKYDRRNLKAERDKLNNKYGVWQPNTYIPLGQLL